MNLKKILKRTGITLLVLAVVLTAGFKYSMTRPVLTGSCVELPAKGLVVYVGEAKVEKTGSGKEILMYQEVFMNMMGQVAFRQDIVSEVNDLVFELLSKKQARIVDCGMGKEGQEPNADHP